MLLYDKKDKDSIRVYEFNGNKEDLMQYRIEEMSKIPENERILEAETYAENWRSISPVFEYYAHVFDEVIIPIEQVNAEKSEHSVHGRYHLLKNVNTGSVNERILLDSYYYGFLNDRNVARIQDLEKIRYLLLKLEIYDSVLYDSRKKIMREIIELPESLYLLQLLEQGKFSLIGDKDISEQLDLFSIDIFNEFSLMELAIMDECGVTENAYERVLEKAKNDAYVLKLVKKLGRLKNV